MSLNVNGEFLVHHDEYKAAVGKYPTGVTVISTIYDKTLLGFTANSFASVSLDPPIISFCLSLKSSNLQGFKNNNHFAVSILASDQENISNHFASRTNNKFANIDYFHGSSSNCPIINGAVSYIECEKLQMIEAGDHMIFTGKALSVKICNDKKPLVYFARGYHSI